MIVVTATPTPPNLFAAATEVAAATENALTLGTATPTPENMVTATPTATPIRVTNTPTPANDATATYHAAFATAMAATTGTPTPLPVDARVVVVLPTPTSTSKPKAPPVPRALPAPTATRTPTAIYVPYDRLVFLTSTPTPEFPSELVGKILFLSDHLAKNPRSPNAFMINPDGTGLALMTDRAFYDRAKARDASSADERFRAYSLREPLGPRNARIQVFYDDAEYASTQHQLTYFGSGTAWAPAWSPRREEVALVSNDSDNDEIWLVQRNEWPPVQAHRERMGMGPQSQLLAGRTTDRLRVEPCHRHAPTMDDGRQRAESATNHRPPVRDVGARVGEVHRFVSATSG